MRPPISADRSGACPRRSRRCANGRRRARLTSCAPATAWCPATTEGAPRAASWKSNPSRSPEGTRPSCRVRESLPASSNGWLPVNTLVSLRQLNRWTLSRQMLLERAELDAVTGIERLAGMQAQYSPSPYIGLWSRIRNFQREELEKALAEHLVYKATLMRGTLQLVSARQFDLFRIASRFPRHVWSEGPRQLAERGIDVEALREEILVALDAQPLKKPELERAFRHRIPTDLPDWVAFSVIVSVGAAINHHEDARFGHFAGSRYRRAPLPAADPEDAIRAVVRSYLAAFGPATRADLAGWRGRSVSNLQTPSTP